MAAKPTYEELKKDSARLKQSLAKLKAESEKYQAIYNHNSNCIYIHDLEGNFLDANDAALRLLGYNREDISTLNISSLISIDQLSVAYSIIEEVVKNGSQKHISEYKVTKKDGNTVWIETESSLINWEGKPIAIHGVARDVNRRKAVENALADSEKNYRELVQGISSVVLKLNPRGNIIFLNAFAQEFFGYKEAELIGKSVIGTIVPQTETSGRNLVAMIKDLGLHPERYVNNENENMRKNGERVWIAWTNKGIQDETGVIIEVLCVGNDITKRKEAENGLKAREKELKNKAKAFEDMNTALQVLLEKREKDERDLEDKIQFNVKQLIDPYLEDLKNTPLSPRQASLHNIIKSNLDEIISPFATNFTSIKYQLTPQEINIAGLIRLGKTTKNISELLGLSLRTIEYHRTKIRHKLGLKNKTENLRSFLLNFKNTSLD
jgi:PAS domain S-box-containing protein